MDAIDRKILLALQDDARLTLTELAERTRISLSSCHRRVRELERLNILIGYRARVDPRLVGLGFEARVSVTMREGGSMVLDEFEVAVSEVPQVLEALRLFGEPDYVLTVVAADLDDFQRLYDSTLSALPGVQRLSSTLVMKTVVADRPLPL